MWLAQRTALATYAAGPAWPSLDVCAALADEAANRSFGQSELRPGEAWHVTALLNLLEKFGLRLGMRSAP